MEDIIQSNNQDIFVNLHAPTDVIKNHDTSKLFDLIRLREKKFSVYEVVVICVFGPVRVRHC